MPLSLRLAPAAVVALILGASAVGCSAAPAGDERTAESEQAITSVTTCPTNSTCCYGSAMAFNLSDPFQAQLSSWGCTLPRLYQPNDATAPNAWWYLSQCSDPNGRVEGFIANNSKYQKSPYYATTSTTLNKYCVAPPAPGYVDVVWDPTCSTCRVY